MSAIPSLFAEHLRNQETVLWSGKSCYPAFLKGIKTYLLANSFLLLIIIWVLFRQENSSLNQWLVLGLPMGIFLFLFSSFKQEFYAITSQRLLIYDSKKNIRSFLPHEMRFIKLVATSGTLYFTEEERRHSNSSTKHIHRIGFRFLDDAGTAQHVLQQWYLEHREGELKTLQKDYEYTKIFHHDSSGVHFSAPMHWPISFYNLKKKPKYLRDFHLTPKLKVPYEQQTWNTVAIQRKTGTLILQIQPNTKTRLKSINTNPFSLLLQLTGWFKITTDRNLEINSFSGLRSELTYGGSHTTLHRDYFLQYRDLQVVAGVHITNLLPGDIRQFDGILKSLDVRGFIA